MASDKFSPVLEVGFVQSSSRARAYVRRFQARRFVFTIRVGSVRRKVVQVLFIKSDGSLCVSFPYFDVTDGIASMLCLPAGLRQAEVSLLTHGKLTSRRVKYVHHPDGEVHFSQTGRVRTASSKKSLPLAEAEGHVFSLYVQGLSHFQQTQLGKDDLPPKLKRTVLDFRLDNSTPEAIKISGRWYEAKTLVTRAGAGTYGPTAPAQRPDGSVVPTFLIGPP